MSNVSPEDERMGELEDQFETAYRTAVKLAREIYNVLWAQWDHWENDPWEYPLRTDPDHCEYNQRTDKIGSWTRYSPKLCTNWAKCSLEPLVNLRKEFQADHSKLKTAVAKLAENVGDYLSPGKYIINRCGVPLPVEWSGTYLFTQQKQDLLAKIKEFQALVETMKTIATENSKIVLSLEKERYLILRQSEWQSEGSTGLDDAQPADRLPHLSSFMAITEPSVLLPTAPIIIDSVLTRNGAAGRGDEKAPTYSGYRNGTADGNARTSEHDSLYCPKDCSVCTVDSHN